MRLVLVDIDGTLIRGRTTERRFAWWLARQRRLGWRQAVAFLFATVRALPRHGVHTLRRNKAYLSGLSRDQLEALGRRFVAERLRAALFDAMVARLEAHVAAGDRIFLVSGTLSFIAEPLAELFGIGCIATVCAERDGRLSAAPPPRHPFGESKADIARELSSATGIGLDATIAYADSIHDRALLESVATPIAVCPDRALRRCARARGWQILEPTCAVGGADGLLGLRPRD